MKESLGEQLSAIRDKLPQHSHENPVVRKRKIPRDPTDLMKQVRENENGD